MCLLRIQASRQPALTPTPLSVQVPQQSALILPKHHLKQGLNPLLFVSITAVILVCSQTIHHYCAGHFHSIKLITHERVPARQLNLRCFAAIILSWADWISQNPMQYHLSQTLSNPRLVQNYEDCKMSAATPLKSGRPTCRALIPTHIHDTAISAVAGLPSHCPMLPFGMQYHSLPDTLVRRHSYRHHSVQASSPAFQYFSRFHQLL